MVSAAAAGRFRQPVVAALMSLVNRSAQFCTDEIVDRIRVHGQRFLEFAGGAGQLAQDQDAILVVTRRHEFLGDEVHAVAQ
jgi:hypothetical protein